MNKPFSMAWLRPAAFLWLSLSLAGVAAAADEPDPPGRVARLSFVQGEVSMQPAGYDDSADSESSQGWTDAEVNRPFTTGDKLWTGQDARAELQVGSAAVRLSGDSGLSLLNVDDNKLQMRMTAGLMDVRVRTLDSDDVVEIETPNLTLSLLRPGHYRLEVNDQGDTTVVQVSEGEAEAKGSTQSVVVHAQQSATFTGTERLATQFATLGAPDAFDSWCLERDRRDQRAETQTAQYVSDDVVGYEDLDDNGSWSSEPEYGYVWTPRAVAVDWSPYRYGRWTYISPWGWTWIDDAPWGFAPFHYGRWAHVSNRWCWVPGPRHVRAVYAPALVGWVGGTGFDVSVSVGGGGGVAWFPLGPREVYVPRYRSSPRYVNRINVTNTVVNTTYVTNVYNNRVTNINYRNRGAVIAVPRDAFVSRQPVSRHVIRVDERQLSRAPVTTRGPEFRPPNYRTAGPRNDERRMQIPERGGMNDRSYRTNDRPPTARGNIGTRPDRPALSDRQNERPNDRQNDQRNDRPGDRPADRPSVDRPNDRAADRPNTSDRPGQFQRPVQTDGQREPGRFNQPSRIPPPAQPNAPSERPSQLERPTDRPQRADRPPQNDRLPQTDRPAQADRPAQSNRPEGRPNFESRPGEQRPNVEHRPVMQNRPEVATPRPTPPPAAPAHAERPQPAERPRPEQRPQVEQRPQQQARPQPQERPQADQGKRQDQPRQRPQDLKSNRE